MREMSARTERVCVLVATMIFCVICFFVRSSAGTDKRRPQRELPADDVCRCSKIAYTSSITGGIWAYPENFFCAVLSNVVTNSTCTHCANMVPTDGKPDSEEKE
jgi:hypothetical protein